MKLDVDSQAAKFTLTVGDLLTKVSNTMLPKIHPIFFLFHHFGPTNLNKPELGGG
jgi:hypothetical protein